MKELSIEEKAKAYDDAYKKVAVRFGSNVADEIFSQFGMSEDERIRKELIRMVKEDWPGRGDVIAWLEKQGKNNMGISEATKQKLEDNLNKALEKETPKSWNEFLEKQGEQEPTDKFEPKFHEGDYIVHRGTENIYQVAAVIDNQYQLKYGDNYTVQKCTEVDRCARLCDITKYAKDGDVLSYCNSQ